MAILAFLGQTLLLLLLVAAAATRTARGGDPDIPFDYLLPQQPAVAPLVDGNYFTFTGMRGLVTVEPPKAFTILRASMAEFPALDGQSISFAVLMYPSGSTNPPHTHPRAGELLFLLDGELQVGFVDSTNKLYTQILEPGDMFVFPKGLVHYQFCSSKGPAVAVSAFSSASPGTVSVAASMFAAGIDDSILANSLGTDVPTIRKLKASIATRV